MIIDIETFTELAVHLKITSDAILKTAHSLAQLGATIQQQSDPVWEDVIKNMLAINNQVTTMEQLLRAVLDANVENKPHWPC